MTTFNGALTTRPSPARYAAPGGSRRLPTSRRSPHCADGAWTRPPRHTPKRICKPTDTGATLIRPRCGIRLLPFHQVEFFTATGTTCTRSLPTTMSSSMVLRWRTTSSPHLPIRVLCAGLAVKVSSEGGAFSLLTSTPMDIRLLAVSSGLRHADRCTFMDASCLQVQRACLKPLTYWNAAVLDNNPKCIKMRPS